MKKALYNFFTRHYNIIVLVFSGFVTLSLIMMGIYYMIYRKSVIKNETMATKQTVDQVANNLDNTLSSIKFTMEFMSTNDMVLEQIIYDNDGDYEAQIDSLSDAWNMAVSVENYRYIYSAEFYIDDRKAISKEHVNYFGWGDAEKRDWYKKLRNSKKSAVWLPPYKSDDDVNDLTAEVFSYISVVKNYKKNISDPVAIIKLNCESKEIYNILNSVELPKCSFFGLCDESGRVIFCSDSSMIGKYSDEIIAASKSSSVYTVTSDIQTNGWVLKAIVAGESEFGLSVSPFTMIVAIVGVIVFCVMLIILFYIVFSKNFISRISSMVSEFETKGTADDILDNRLEYILQSYKDMIADKYKDEILLKEAELKSLQSQINPHFLYNTLDSVNWLVKCDENRSAEKMLTDLADYFRFSLSKSKDIVTIQNELDIADAYMRIQKNRFGNKFCYETHIDNEVLKYKIPKLTIQPFLENSLIHGIRDVPNSVCNINVSVVENDDCIEIGISDNGKGMTDEQMKKLFNDCGGYGVYNVNRRLQLFSGDDNYYGIDVHSVVDKYTSVTIKIKKII